jgi:hypothetical protein
MDHLAHLEDKQRNFDDDEKHDHAYHQNLDHRYPFAWMGS